jgi:hypothetical protein
MTHPHIIDPLPARGRVQQFPLRADNPHTRAHRGGCVGDGCRPTASINQTSEVFKARISANTPCGTALTAPAALCFLPALVARLLTQAGQHFSCRYRDVLHTSKIVREMCCGPTKVLSR